MVDIKLSRPAHVQVVVEGHEQGPLRSLKPTAVASVHLDAKDEEQRVKAFSRCLEQAVAQGTRELIVCGDLNTECLPGSCVAAFEKDAPSPTDEE